MGGPHPVGIRQVGLFDLAPVPAAWAVSFAAWPLFSFLFGRPHFFNCTTSEGWNLTTWPTWARVLALAKPYKPSSTLTPTKANASPETPTRRPRGRLPRRPGPGPNQRCHPVGCRHGAAGQVGARAWPRGGGLGLARVRVSRVRVLAQREAAEMAGTWRGLAQSVGNAALSGW